MALDGGCSSASGKAVVEQSMLPTTNQHQFKRRRVRRTDSDNEGNDDSNDDEPGWNITSEMKERIRQSTWLRKELQDGGLRQLIDEIDAASEEEEEETSDVHRRGKWTHTKNKNPNVTPISARELALARAKHSHPKFASFTDQVLLLAGVLQPSNDGGEAGEKEENGHGGHLVLAPVPRLNNNSVSLTLSNNLGSKDGRSNSSCDDDEDSDDNSSSSSSSSGEEDSDEINGSGGE